MAENPLDLAAAASTGQNPLDRASASIRSSNPLDIAAHAKKADPWAAARAGGGFVLEHFGITPQSIDLLDRPRQTVQAAIAGDDPWRTFVHHAGPDQQDANRAAVRKKLGVSSEAERATQPPIWRGAVDLGVDTLTDPLTYASAGVEPLVKGALGLLGRGALKVAPESATAASHMAQDFFTAGGSAKRELGTPAYEAAISAKARQGAKEAEANRRLQLRLSAATGHLGDNELNTVAHVLNGEVPIEQVKPHIAEAAKNTRKLLNDAAAMEATPTGLRKLAYGGGRLANTRLVQAATQGKLRGGVFKPGQIPTRPAAQLNSIDPWNINYQKPLQELNPIQRAAQMEHPDDIVGRVQWRKGPFGKAERVPIPPRKVTTGKLRQYELPPELQEFAAPPSQGIFGAENLRRDYFPAPHTGEDIIGKNVRPEPFNLLRPNNVNAEQREQFEVGGTAGSKLREALAGRMASAARGATTGRMRDELGVGRMEPWTAPKALTDLFEVQPRPRGTARTPGEVLSDKWRQVVNIPKNTVTTLGLKHGLVNVPWQAFKSEGPGAAVESLVQGAKHLKRTPEQQYDFLRQAIEGGVISPFGDRANPIADTLGRLPVVGGPLGKVSHGANSLTWAIDDAAKAAVLKRKLARGMPATEAAAQTRREMVDYANSSPFTEALKNVFPFATWRSKLPAAFASATLRHPERTLAASRATQGLASSGNANVTMPGGGQYHVTMKTPDADVIDALGTDGQSNPFKYLRAGLADPIKMLPTAVGDVAAATGGDDRGAQQLAHLLRYFTYGQPNLPYKSRDDKKHIGFAGQSLIDYVPMGLGAAAIQPTGLSDFAPEDILNILLGSPFGLHARAAE
jgi:hypothetical protein